MGRVKREVEVAGRNFWTLFDTGAVNTFVVEQVASLVPSFPLPRPETVRLGGAAREVDRGCFLACLVEGRSIHALARVLPEIGRDEQGRSIEIRLGALAMQEWGIVPIPKEERLDMTHYPEVFTEF